MNACKHSLLNGFAKMIDFACLLAHTPYTINLKKSIKKTMLNA